MKASDHWLADAYRQGLVELDTDSILASMAHHVTVKGEWEIGVISPSLAGTECPLSRVKKFLGHKSQPGQPHMAVRAGVPDSVSNMNFLRGFCMEGVVVTCLRHVLGEAVVDHAPGFAPSWQATSEVSGEVFGPRYAGHPDMLIVGEGGELELVQIKSPSIFKFERIEKMGREDAIKSYFAQMAVEMFICRKAGFPVARNNLFMATWEGTPKISKARAMVFELDWIDSMEQVVTSVGEETAKAAHLATSKGIWPEAYPEHKWNSFPCSYCNFPRKSSNGLRSCEDHVAWSPRP